MIDANRKRRQKPRQFCSLVESIRFRTSGPFIRSVAVWFVVWLFIWQAALARSQSLPMAAPDTNDDPSCVVAWNPMTNQIVAGFNIYYGGKSGVYTNKTSVGTSSTSLPIYGLTQGFVYYFAATTYSAAGAESALSAEVSWTNYLVTLTNQIFQVWSTTNLLLNVQNPTWSTMFFRMSNGWLCASARLVPADWNQITHFDFTNAAALRATNILQYKTTP